MSDRTLIVTLVWNGTDFAIPAENSDSSNEATLVIDESQRTTTVQIPERYGIVQKRTMQRRAQSIAKGGFQYTSELRIGIANELIIEAKEEIPSVLLQVGHSFRGDYSGEVPPPYNDKLMEMEPDYYSSAVEADYQSFSSSYNPSPIHQHKSIYQTDSNSHCQESVTSTYETSSPIHGDSTQKKVQKARTESSKLKSIEILGKFVINLVNLAEIVLITRLPNHYSAEFGSGRVDFTMDSNLNITIISSTGSQEEEDLLRQVLEMSSDL